MAVFLISLTIDVFDINFKLITTSVPEKGVLALTQTTTK